jgi:hypothetical protein
MAGILRGARFSFGDNAMMRILIAAFVSFGLLCGAQAQKAVVVAACGSDSLDIGEAHGLYIDSTGILCILARARPIQQGGVMYRLR